MQTRELHPCHHLPLPLPLPWTLHVPVPELNRSFTLHPASSFLSYHRDQLALSSVPHAASAILELPSYYTLVGARQILTMSVSLALRRFVSSGPCPHHSYDRSALHLPAQYAGYNPFSAPTLPSVQHAGCAILHFPVPSPPLSVPDTYHDRRELSVTCAQAAGKPCPQP